MASPDDFVQDTAYAQHFHTYQAVIKRFLGQDPGRGNFDLPKHALIVDVGCGYGEFMRQLADRGHTNLVGVEPDPTCRAGARAAGLDVREGMLTETGLPDAFADVAVVNEVFHHIADYERAADELSRILKPAGIFCFSEPRNTLLRRAMDFLTLDVPLQEAGPRRGGALPGHHPRDRDGSLQEVPARRGRVLRRHRAPLRAAVARAGVLLPVWSVSEAGRIRSGGALTSAMRVRRFPQDAELSFPQLERHRRNARFELARDGRAHRDRRGRPGLRAVRPWRDRRCAPSSACRRPRRSAHPAHRGRRSRGSRRVPSHGAGSSRAAIAFHPSSIRRYGSALRAIRKPNTRCRRPPALRATSLKSSRVNVTHGSPFAGSGQTSASSGCVQASMSLVKISPRARRMRLHPSGSSTSGLRQHGAHDARRKRGVHRQSRRMPRRPRGTPRPASGGP